MKKCSHVGTMTSNMPNRASFTQGYKWVCSTCGRPFKHINETTMSPSAKPKAKEPLVTKKTRTDTRAGKVRSSVSTKIAYPILRSIKLESQGAISTASVVKRFFPEELRAKINSGFEAGTKDVGFSPWELRSMAAAINTMANTLMDACAYLPTQRKPKTNSVKKDEA